MIRAAFARGPFLRLTGAYAWECLYNYCSEYEVVAFSRIPERFDTPSLEMQAVRLHWLQDKETLTWAIW